MQDRPSAANKYDVKASGSQQADCVGFHMLRTAVAEISALPQISLAYSGDGQPKRVRVSHGSCLLTNICTRMETSPQQPQL
jgi:hypothetical protein